MDEKKNQIVQLKKKKKTEFKINWLKSLSHTFLIIFMGFKSCSYIINDLQMLNWRKFMMFKERLLVSLYFAWYGDLNDERIIKHIFFFKLLFAYVLYSLGSDLQNLRQGCPKSIYFFFFLIHVVRQQNYSFIKR